MIITVKCLYCDGIGTVAHTGPSFTATCPSCYGVATQRVRVHNLDEIDERSIEALHELSELAR